MLCLTGTNRSGKFRNKTDGLWALYCMILQVKNICHLFSRCSYFLFIWYDFNASFDKLKKLVPFQHCLGLHKSCDVGKPRPGRQPRSRHLKLDALLHYLNSTLLGRFSNQFHKNNRQKLFYYHPLESFFELVRFVTDFKRREKPLATFQSRPFNRIVCSLGWGGTEKHNRHRNSNQKTHYITSRHEGRTCLLTRLVRIAKRKVSSLPSSFTDPAKINILYIVFLIKSSRTLYIVLASSSV